MKPSVSTIFPFLLAAFSALLFGVSTPFSKLLLQKVHPFMLAGMLYLGASAGLLPVLLFRHELPDILTINKKNINRLLVAIVAGGIMGPVFLLAGLNYSSASSVSLWLNLELVATVVIGFLFFNDYLASKGWIGVVLALAASILLTVNEGTAGIVSAMFVLLACLCWGLDNHVTALVDGISAVYNTFVKGLAAGLVNITIGVIISGIDFGIATIVYSLLLGCVSYGISIVLYIISAQKIGAIRSQIIFSSAPFFGVFFSVVILSEQLTPLQVISFILLLLSIGIIMFEKHDHYHEHAPLTHTHVHRHDDLHHDHSHDDDSPQPIHEHAHQHKNKKHGHPHWPDIHHRHEH